jgi:hypothetical protein
MRNGLPYHGGQIASGEAIKDEAAMLGKAREQVNVRQEMPLVRLAPKAIQPLVIPKPGLSARNLLFARGETSYSRRHKTALRNDNHL